MPPTTTFLKLVDAQAVPSPEAVNFAAGRFNYVAICTALIGGVANCMLPTVQPLPFALCMIGSLL
jgi:hypothetical protein